MVYSLPCSLSSTISQRLLKFMSIKLIMLSNYLIFYCPPSSFAISLSQHQGLFQWISSSHQVAKILELQHQSFLNEYSVLIFFKTNLKGLTGLFAVQGIFKGLLQNHNLKASILWCPVFFMVQLSHAYMTAGKTIGLTIWIFIGKMMSLAF